ncbi:hypothetical protein QZH56_36725 [Streptomyces olivoreticuli]|uniref:hypothetical protein n=1 Tax=Streptomyces olivoreticuli TaxID=68246 RepID=UPI002658AD43|nr:hypothetical protein [Streptomyces olivoreticuli]WKK24123.1 hypothetical protein QZH56_36725 [Streptomyces olivoreticuli]
MSILDFTPATTADGAPDSTVITMPAAVLNHLRTLATTDSHAPRTQLATARRVDTPWHEPASWKAACTADVPALDWMMLELCATTHEFIENRTRATQHYGFTIHDVDAARMETSRRTARTPRRPARRDRRRHAGGGVNALPLRRVAGGEQ